MRKLPLAAAAHAALIFSEATLYADHHHRHHHHPANNSCLLSSRHAVTCLQWWVTCHAPPATRKSPSRRVLGQAVGAPANAFFLCECECQHQAVKSCSDSTPRLAFFLFVLQSTRSFLVPAPQLRAKQQTAHVTRHALAGSLSLSLRNQLLPQNASKGRNATREHCTEAAVNSTALWFKCSRDAASCTCSPAPNMLMPVFSVLLGGSSFRAV